MSYLTTVHSFGYRCDDGDRKGELNIVR